jgi:hypothetical protein
LLDYRASFRLLPSPLAFIPLHEVRWGQGCYEAVVLERTRRHVETDDMEGGIRKDGIGTADAACLCPRRSGKANVVNVPWSSTNAYTG